MLRAPSAASELPAGPVGRDEDTESLLEPGALRERFSVARREARRPPRWFSDILGSSREEPSHHHAEPARELELARRAGELEARARQLDEREQELRSLARRDATLRDRERWVAELREELERRLTELDTVADRLERREVSVLGREEAAARWFTELTRAQEQLGNGWHESTPAQSPVRPDAAL